MREKRGTSRWKRHKGTTRLVLKHASPLNNALAAIYPNITRGKQALNPLPHLCFHTSLARIWTKTLIPFQHLRKDTKIKQGDIKHTNEKRNAKRREERGERRRQTATAVLRQRRRRRCPPRSNPTINTPNSRPNTIASNEGAMPPNSAPKVGNAPTDWLKARMP
ncbi:Uncharacterised protein [Edwardsiella tarda]|nr:Uncharacterised protein [Edwardsiella tarda]